ncbi:MAG: ABC transporter ATP-binding protein [bacterium]
MSEAIVFCKNISHGYKNKTVLNTVSWSINPGDHWAVIGPSGAGKTTLLEIMAGYTWPNAGGTVFHQGQKQVNLSQWRRKIGWLNQDLNRAMPDGQSVLDSVLSGVHSQKELYERRNLFVEEKHYHKAQTILDQFELNGFESRSFGSLSQGEQQLVLLGRALIDSPIFVVLDEPCTGLDPGHREQFLTVLKEFADRDHSPATIYVTHRIEEILPSFEKTLALKNGRAIERGRTEEVLSEGTLSSLFQTDVQLQSVNGRYWPVYSDG